MLKHFSRSFGVSSPIRVNYGFIGLGQMGQHMARHIYDKLDPKDRLYVFDVMPEATTKFVESVTSQTPSNKDLLTKLNSVEDFVNKVDSQLDFIVTMVPEGRHVKKVITTLVDEFKSRGFDHMTTFVDSSTIDIPSSIDIHDHVKREIPTFDFVDAPVSGGVAGARKGSLSFMLSKPDHESISPFLNGLMLKMGKNIFPCGAKHGSGLAAKLSNNYLLAVTNLAVADSFQLAKSFGLDLNHYAKLVAVSTGKCWAAVNNCPIPGVYPEHNLPSDVGYEGGFVSKLTRKDLVLATQSAKDNNRFLFLGDIGKFWYDKACEDQELANRDLAVFYKWLEDIDEEKGNKMLQSK